MSHPRHRLHQGQARKELRHGEQKKDMPTPGPKQLANALESRKKKKRRPSDAGSLDFEGPTSEVAAAQPETDPDVGRDLTAAGGAKTPWPLVLGDTTIAPWVQDVGCKTWIQTERYGARLDI